MSDGGEGSIDSSERKFTRKQIKPVYIRKLVAFIDAVRKLP
jgi:hypothetical protein